MRKGEIFNLKWEDVDFKRGVISVNNREDFHTQNFDNRIMTPLPATSAGRNRMHPVVGEALSRHPRYISSPYLFCNKNNEPYKDVKRSFAGALTRAGITNFRFHALRHTFGSWLVMSGVDLATAQELMGHKTISMTLH